jgi:hypothetical protein
MARPAHIKAKAETEVTTQSPTLVQWATKLRRLKDQKETLEAQLTEGNRAIDELSEKLANEMESMGVDKLRVPNVGSVFIQIKNRPNVVDQPGLLVWMKEHGFDAMVKETIHPQSLIGWVNEELEAGHELPAAINNYQQKRAIIRRS